MDRSAKRSKTPPTVGQTFNFLTLLEILNPEMPKYKQLGKFLCIFENCGNIKEIPIENVIYTKSKCATKSCGCLTKILASRRTKANGRTYGGNNKYPASTETFPTDDKILGYICGLLATDGCLSDRGGIALALKDKETVDWVRRTLTKEGKPANERKGGNFWEFKLTLPKLYQYCLDMGITPRKTYNLSVILEGKSDEFKHYFFRGALDGDGFVTYREAFPQNMLGISGASVPFLNQLSAIMPVKGEIKISSKKGTKSTYKGKIIQATVDTYHLLYKGTAAKHLAILLPKADFTMRRKTELIRLVENIVPLYNAPKYTELFGRVLNPSVNNTRYLLDDGIETLPAIRMAEKYNIRPDTLKVRLKLGWDLMRALTTPVGPPTRGKKS